MGRDQRVAGAVPHDRDEPLAPSRAQPDPQVARINLWCGLSLFAPEIDRGPVYEFHLNHVLVPDSPTALFRTEYEEV